jgi:hypothetical protein
MGLLGQGWDDPQSNAIMQLAGGLLGGNFAQGAAAYGNTMAGAKDAAMKRQFLQSQMDENASQNEARKLAALKAERQMDFDAKFMGFGPAAAAGGESGGGAPVANASPAGAFTAQDISKRFGIPMEAVVSDYRFNGGKKIAELISDRSKPAWQNVNGNLVNTNAAGFGGGMQAGMATSADGKVTAWQPDGQGSVVVGAPHGALETFGAYQDAQSARKPIKVYNPTTGREEYTNEGAVVGRQPSGSTPAIPGYATELQMKASAAGNMGADPAAIQREIKAVQANLFQTNLDEPSKALLRAHLADLQKQAQQPGVAQSGNFAAGPSATEAAQAKATEARVVDTAKADVVRDTGRQKKELSAEQMIAASRRARELLNEGPTASGLGQVLDSTSAFFGMSNKGAEVASKLDIVSGDLVNNVPRMEGPQSDGDRIEYKTQAGRAADRSLPIKQRLAAIDEVEKLQMRYSKYNGGTNDGGASGQWGDKPKAPQSFDAKPPAQQFKGKFVTSPDGKRYQSDGMIWKEVK